MSLFITSLNSGSNGNCYYVSNGTDAILVDAGISCREIEIRMKRLGLSMASLRAVFISHEHTDHISGLTVLTKKYQLPVYITSQTLLHGRLKLDKHLVNTFTSVQPVLVGELEVSAFQKHHDAADPYSFVISYRHTKVGVFTDIGKPCKNLVHHFKQCHAAFLESNYDERMLAEGRYPYFLKQRISGGNGHLSNDQALKLFKAHKPAFMTHLLLSHLSKNNNCPQLVKQLFDQHAAGVMMIIASREEETPIFHIHGSMPAKKVVSNTMASPQLSLAFC